MVRKKGMEERFKKHIEEQLEEKKGIEERLRDRVNKLSPEEKKKYERIWHHFVWILGGADKESDWMAHMCEDTEEKTFTLKYRFRYYNSNDPWDGEDEKSGATVVDRYTDQNRLERYNKMVKTARYLSDTLIKEGFGNREDYEEVHIDGLGKKLYEILKTKEWAHIKVIPAEDKE